MVSLAATTRPASRSRRGLRLRLALVAGLAIATFGAAGALAVANGTFPIRFNLVEAGKPQDKPAVRASLSPEEQAALEAKKRRAAADNQAAQKPASGKEAYQPALMSLGDAEAAFGTHVLVPAGLTPTAVFFLDASGLPAPTKPGAQAPGNTVFLKFEAGGGVVDMAEERDTSDEPLTVTALDQDGPMLKADGGLGRAEIETVDGGSYAVGWSVDGQSVVTVIFKSTSGVVVTIRFGPGVSHDEALAFATNLR